METVILQFQGIRDLGLLAVVTAAIALALVGYGASQFLRRRRRHGATCLLAALPAAAALPLAGELSYGLWMLALGLQVALAVAVFYAAVYAYLGPRRLAVLMAMRCAAVLALLLVLFKPAISVVPDSSSHRPALPILIDRSESMATADTGGSASRYAQALGMLKTQDRRLRASVRPAYYHFARQLQAAESLEALGRLAPRGEGTDATDIAGALTGCLADYDRAELGGVFLVTDGLHNAPASVLEALGELGVPVYAIGAGSHAESQTGRRNLQLLAIEAPYDAVVNNVTVIEVQVRAVGLANQPAELRLLEDGNVVASFALVTDQGVATLACPLRWVPRERPAGAPAGTDLRRLQVLIPPEPAEVSTDDNRAELHVLARQPQVRLLYIEGVIRPEYKFLWRVLNIDPNLKFMALVRVDRNRFSAYGQEEGAPPPDLPRSQEDFRRFDVIVLGDLDATFLSAAQQAGLKKFVADGGGLLMIGGHNSFGPGGYAGTPLEEVLPVTVGPRTQPQETTAFLPLLTAEGRNHPVFEGIADWFAGPGQRLPDPNLPRLPDLLGCVTVAGPKPGASLLAVHPTRRNEHGPLVVLAVQPFGAGRAAAFTADTTWQWHMATQAAGAEGPYRLFWAQMVRWLANVQTRSASASATLVLRTDKPHARAGADIRITARVQDEKGKPANSASLTCRVEPVGPHSPDAVRAVTLTRRGADGLFQGAYRPDGPGEFLIRAAATDSAGAPLASDELPLTVTPASAELDTLARNETLLQAIADRTGGRYADLSGLPEIVEALLDRQKALAPPAPKGTTHHLYDFTLLFLLFAALLTGEWLLRRNWQLH